VEITVWQAEAQGAALERSGATVLEPGPDEVLLEVLHCGLCHSDVSMLDNAWGISTYPLVPGHEVVGRVSAVGAGVSRSLLGSVQGLGWFAGSCRHCDWCVGGHANLCPSLEAVVVGRHGGFASHVLAHQDWIVPIPAGLAAADAGPLFCGGITVFAPLFDEAVSPTARVAVIGIGGLGHLALQFARAWGCEVTAITTSMAKAEEARQLGAHRVLSLAELGDHPGAFDLIINTSNHDLDWPVLISGLAPLGRLHQLGVPPSPLEIPAFPLIGGRRSVTGSPTSSPATLRRMVDFCGRHGITPQVEHLPMAEINTAIARLRRGDVRYRFVLAGPA
jgi:alcohol/geraniol dehydrogenase (NADP+)